MAEQDQDSVEPVDFKAEGNAKLILRLADGSVLEAMVHIGQVLRNGNDQGTGIPIYGVQSQLIVRTLQCGPGTRIDPSKPKTRRMFS